MKIIGLINQKGGVGKTTTASALAHGLVEKGKKVLLIDMDSQANLTSSLGINTNELEKTVYDWMIQDAKFKDVVIKINKDLDLMPANIKLSIKEVELNSVLAREQRLSMKIKTIPAMYNYDYIIIDSSPYFGAYTMNVLVAANEIIIPFKPEWFSVEGINDLVTNVGNVKSAINQELKINGFLATIVDVRTKSSKQVMEMVKEFAEEYGTKFYETFIRSAVAAADAPAYHQSAISYKGSTAAEDYQKFVEEFLMEENK